MKDFKHPNWSYERAMWTDKKTVVIVCDNHKQFHQFQRWWEKWYITEANYICCVTEEDTRGLVFDDKFDISRDNTKIFDLLN